MRPFGHRQRVLPTARTLRLSAPLREQSDAPNFARRSCSLLETTHLALRSFAWRVFGSWTWRVWVWPSAMIASSQKIAQIWLPQQGEKDTNAIQLRASRPAPLLFLSPQPRMRASSPRRPRVYALGNSTGNNSTTAPDPIHAPTWFHVKRTVQPRRNCEFVRWRRAAQLAGHAPTTRSFTVAVPRCRSPFHVKHPPTTAVNDSYQSD